MTLPATIKDVDGREWVLTRKSALPARRCGRDIVTVYFGRLPKGKKPHVVHRHELPNGQIGWVAP